MKREMTQQPRSPADKRRGTGKRTRESEDIEDIEELLCLPLAKQTKISEFFPGKTKDIFNIPVSNTFSPLAEMTDEDVMLKVSPDKLLTNPSSNNTTKSKRSKKDTISGIQPKDCIREGESCLSDILFEHSTTLDLVAKTVDYIFKFIRDIRGSLEKIITLVSLKGKDSPPDALPEDRTIQMPRAPDLPHIISQVACKHENEQIKEEQLSISSHNLFSASY